MINNQMRREGGFTEIGILVIALVLLAGVGFYAYQNYQTNKLAVPSSAIQKAVPAIDSLAFASELDSRGGAKTPATSFSATTPVIYAVAGVSKTGQKARIEYVRYLNDKFVDNGSLALSKADSKFASFSFKINPGAVHPLGNYKVKVYANGKFVRQGVYSVK